MALLLLTSVLPGMRRRWFTVWQVGGADPWPCTARCAPRSMHHAAPSCRPCGKPILMCQKHKLMCTAQAIPVRQCRAVMLRKLVLLLHAVHVVCERKCCCHHRHSLPKLIPPHTSVLIIPHNSTSGAPQRAAPDKLCMWRLHAGPSHRRCSRDGRGAHCACEHGYCCGGSVGHRCAHPLPLHGRCVCPTA